MKKKEVMKHSAAIQSSNTQTLLQRRMFNVLLANAFDDLKIKRKFHIPLTDLAEVLEYHSKDWEHFKKALRGLMTSIVEWDVFGKCKRIEWHASTLLASVEIVGGMVTYSYSEFLREQFMNPGMYARISLKMQNKFESKYSQALWELCVDIFDEKRGEGETRWLELAEYRKFMGIPEGKYPGFNRFNYRVVKEPIAEICKVSDFAVSIDQRSHGRKVTALKVKVSRKDRRPQNHSTKAIMPKVTASIPTSIPSASITDLTLLATTAKEIVEKWPLYKPLFEDLSKLSPIALAVVQGWQEKVA